MSKISAYPEDTAPTPAGFAIGDDASATTKKTKWQSLINMFFQNPPDSGNSGFAGLVQSYTPTLSGEQGGTWTASACWYVDLFGIKIMWGNVLFQASGTTGRCSVSLPPGNFFNTVQAYLPAITSEGNNAYQVASGDSIVGSPPAVLGVYVSNTGPTGSAGVSFLCIGT